jgi:hypothetical protein
LNAESRSDYKSELAQGYAPNISSGAALNRLATWIKTNPKLTEALKETNYRVNQQLFTSRQVALIFEYLGEPVEIVSSTKSCTTFPNY